MSERDLQEATADAWTDSMGKEENHMETKEKMRLMEAVSNGLVPFGQDLGGMTVDEIAKLWAEHKQRLAKKTGAKQLRSCSMRSASESPCKCTHHACLGSHHSCLSNLALRRPFATGSCRLLRIPSMTMWTLSSLRR